MFQTFDTVSDRKAVAGRVARLRQWMAERRLDGVIVPRADEHQGEYVAPPAERLSWLTGFTGSAGAAVILVDRAVLLVDGRYTLQAATQTDAAIVSIGDLVATPVEDWVAANAGSGSRIGFDPWLHTSAQAARLRRKATDAGIEVVALEDNPVDAVREDRPAWRRTTATDHPVAFAGQAVRDKLSAIRTAVAVAGTDAAILSDPSSLGWAFNMRGNDLPHVPTALGFAIIPADGPAEIFLTAARPDKTLVDTLGDQAVFRKRSSLLPRIAALGKAGKRLLADPATTPEALDAAARTAGAAIVAGRDPVVLPRAMKNATELDGARAAHLRDGAAMATFLAWLDRQAPGTISEIDAAKKLEQVRASTARRLGSRLLDISFDTISGAGPNGAIVHYRVTTDTNRMLGDGELYLVDSGGQYRDGTTDITRTIAVGAPSDAMRHHFTLVLKGMIAVSDVRFPPGTRGVDLDVLARRALWAAGLDYAHGTGHGVGSYLSVHEGPQSLSKRGMEVLQPGMILSNEPGFYREGEYGIRIENLVVVTGAATPSGGERAMHGFETLTLCPIDRRLIDTSLLDRFELRWIDAYHARVGEALLPLVPPGVRGWLKKATRALPRMRRR